MTLREKLEADRKQWSEFRKTLKEKTFTRTILSIESNKSVSQTNFSTFTVQTERGITKMVLNKATPIPSVGSVVEFKISAYKGSFDKFYISEIVKEIPKAGEHYLFELWEREELKKMYANGL